MDSNLTILVVEDDNDTCKKFENITKNSSDLEIIGTTGNADNAINIITEKLPDIVILDLELHMGGGSGIDVLKGIKDLHLDNPPYILVTTNNSSQITYELARQLGADYIMSKHQEGYSEYSVIEFLDLLSNIIKGRKIQNTNNISIINSERNDEKYLKKRIISELNYIGINPKAVGYKYLIDGILIITNQPIHNLCDVIAKKYNKTEASVERAMQNAINRAWASSNIDELLTHYKAKISSSKGVPTLTEFVFYYANKISND